MPVINDYLKTYFLDRNNGHLLFLDVYTSYVLTIFKQTISCEYVTRS